MRFSNIRANATIASLLDQLKKYFTSELKKIGEPEFNWRNAIFVKRNKVWYEEMPREEIKPNETFYDLFGKMQLGVIIEIMPEFPKGIKVYLNN